ncbi:MAG: AraC family transcriptional regulator [Bacteroidetes bacterium]|nr:AraC family transcriptional regulator [Bacteroidota bacterium]
MSAPLSFQAVAAYSDFNQQATPHPLVNLVDLAKADPRHLRRMHFGLYVVFLKESKCGDLRYGCDVYDYAEGTLVFVAPGQVIGSDKPEEVYQPQGRALVFHPDLLHGTTLGGHIGQYTFFGYQANEALHVSEEEHRTLTDLLANTGRELQRPRDAHSDRLIVAYIALFLQHCARFYDRQFATRKPVNKGTLARFEELVHEYYNSGRAQEEGLATVGYFAHAMNLSPNYFGDLVKSQTGRSAQEYLQDHLIAVAKERMHRGDRSVSEVAYALGFKYPQHFTRLFKQRVGHTPNAYREMIA